MPGLFVSRDETVGDIPESGYSRERFRGPGWLSVSTEECGLCGHIPGYNLLRTNMICGRGGTVDATDLNSVGETRAGSTPAARTLLYVSSSTHQALLESSP